MRPSAALRHRRRLRGQRRRQGLQGRRHPATTSSSATTTSAATGPTASTTRRTSSSSRDSTEYGDFPMPRVVSGLPEPRTGARLPERLRRPLRPARAIEFGTEVVRREPLSAERAQRLARRARRPARSATTPGSWSPTATTGTSATRTTPACSPAGDPLQGLQAPRRPRGRARLVVGGGNSGCDIAVEAARTSAARTSRCAAATGSCRRASSASPSPNGSAVAAALGAAPVREARRPRELRLLRALRPAASGLPAVRQAPDRQLAAPLLLRHGSVRPRRPTSSASTATPSTSPTARARDYDTIVWATGFNVSFPFLDRGLLRVGERRPVRGRGLSRPASPTSTCSASRSRAAAPAR